ncbi:hypothetical protein [Dankookia sp. P2]|uniref:hypothetical protein n=1 Tax=Dankookia sp. P2 TaxID=3423955 RepID=UPI003D665212
MDQYVVACRRRGKEWADRHFRPVGRGPEPDKILDIVEADHSRAHVAVIDDVSGVNLGRPWVTVALDRYSRLPLAVHVHFDGQSLTAVMQALRQTMLPKDFLKELFPDLRLAYGASGVPVAYFFDRGSDFDNDHIVDVGFTFDIRMDYAPVGCPEFKGRIERFFRTMHAEVAHPLPGATPPLLVDSNAREGQVNLR